MMKVLTRLGLVCLVGMGPAACGGVSTAIPSPTTPSASGASAADLAFCASETNRYRALAGLSALTESTSLEAVAAAAAEADTRSDTPHGYSLSNPSTGVAAENEALRWGLATFGTTHNAIAQALAGFWDEGPGGGHYANMAGPYAQLGCGVFVSGPLITIVQDFR